MGDKESKKNKEGKNKGKNKNERLNFKWTFMLLFILGFILFFLFVSRQTLAEVGDSAGLEEDFNIQDLLELEDEIKQLEDVDKEALLELTEKEREIQQELFNLSRELETLQDEKESLEEEIEQSSEKLNRARDKKQQQEDDLQKLEGELMEVFHSFQRRGPLSYFQIVLGAEDLGDFLQRLNIIKDVFSNINNLFTSYTDERDRLLALEEEVTEQLLRLYQLENKLEENIEKAYDKKQEQEGILESVRAELHDYEEQMERLERVWINQTKPFLAELAVVLDRFIEEDKLDQDKISIGGTFFNPIAEITEEDFNSFFEEEEQLPSIFFEFGNDEVFLELPGGNLTFKGNIISKGDSMLSFQIEEARFFDIYLGEDVIDELTEDIELGFDFGAEMGNYRIDKIDVLEGKLVLDIVADYF